MITAYRNTKGCPTAGYASAIVAPQPLLSDSRHLYSITVLTH